MMRNEHFFMSNQKLRQIALMLERIGVHKTTLLVSFRLSIHPSDPIDSMPNKTESKTKSLHSCESSPLPSRSQIMPPPGKKKPPSWHRRVDDCSRLNENSPTGEERREKRFLTVSLNPISCYKEGRCIYWIHRRYLSVGSIPGASN